MYLGYVSESCDVVVDSCFMKNLISYSIDSFEMLLDCAPKSYNYVYFKMYLQSVVKPFFVSLSLYYSHYGDTDDKSYCFLKRDQIIAMYEKRIIELGGSVDY